MSDHQPDDPSSGSFIAAIDELLDDPALNPPVLPPPDLTPDELAFLEDVSVYHNAAEASALLPTFYKLYIRTTHLPDVPYMLDVEINGAKIADALREGLLAAAKLYTPEDNISDLRAEMMSDPDFIEIDETMRRFFVRNFPKLTVHLYNIAVEMSVMAGVSKVLDPSERDAREEMVKRTLKRFLREFQRDIKRMLEARTSGRPKKIISTRGLPEIVNQVINTARSMMGDRRGENAVPGLKEIAVALKFPSSEALGKQLKRAYYPWLLSIKPYLAALPPDNNPT